MTLKNPKTNVIPGVNLKSTGVKLQLNRLNRAFQVIRSISHTLESAITADDPCYVIMITTISPYGVGLSSAYCFMHDAEKGILKGHLGFNTETQADFSAIWKGIIKEYRRKFHVSETDLYGGKIPFTRTLDLVESLGSQRQHVFKCLQGTTRKLREITIDFSNETRKNQNSILTSACSSKQVTRVTKDAIKEELPQALLEQLDDEFIILPLSHNDDICFIIFADKKFQYFRFRPIDFLKLEWFRAHTTLMLRNAKLIKDLRIAFEETKQIDDLKTNFLSIISHELRTPLTSIYGFLELLMTGKAGDLTATQQQLVDRSLQNAQVLINKVNNLIELAHFKLEGLEHAEIETIDPLNILITVMSDLESHARLRKVEVEPVIKGEIPPIRANEKALSKIYHHLLDNAIKFSPAGDKVTIECDYRDNKVMVSFIDNGPGIPDDKLQKIFDYFYQVEEPMTRSHEGMGIGLTITRFLLKATGGQLDVSTEPQKGSTFTVTYPAATE